MPVFDQAIGAETPSGTIPVPCRRYESA